VTVALIALTVLVSGFLAGATADRLVVQLPAFARTGVVPWARFSRNADLANGRFFYPPLAFGATLLAIAAWLTRPGVPIALTAVLETTGLLLTFVAGPNMLRLGRTSDDDVATLERSFAGFRGWSTVRGTAHVLGFVAAVWAQASVLG
jgi:hypothetical protein